ncbi:MAG: hypothetical protein Q9Q40_00905 [Acidobacteriota bacterium]|nr:hypothetical protein [Acidobacteriota bacterium]MDQ7087002.1 hypothetical protein [Acidobacteriota bacterium]
MGRRRNWVSEKNLEELLAGRHLHEPPASTLRKAEALAARLPDPARSGGWLVELVFDSWESAAEVRAGVLQLDRRLLYRLTSGNEEREVDLRLRRDERGRLEVAGQVLPPEGAEQVVVVAGRGRRRQALGGTGDFLFRGLSGSVPVGLEVWLTGGGKLVIESLPLPEDPDRP